MDESGTQQKEKRYCKIFKTKISFGNVACYILKPLLLRHELYKRVTKLLSLFIKYANAMKRKLDLCIYIYKLDKLTK